MWALRFLNGPQAGQLYVLKNGRNRIGRSSGCDLQLNSAGISKEHVEIQVVNKQVTLQDLQSSNGTFINGLRVQKSQLRLGDKISLHQLLLDVVPAPAQMPQALQPQGALVAFPQSNQPMPTPMAGHASGPALTSAPPASSVQNFQQKAEAYLHEIVLPGLYRLLEVFHFRSVMLGFVVVFIFTVTLLSILPMNQITSESIRTESRRRAQTVARALANSNEKAVRSGEMSSYSADLVLRDEGISHVYILGKDGSIIAPPEMVGMNAKELAGFASQIKGQTREMSAEISGGQIAASCPILVFDPELQQNVAKAYAVVVYDQGSLKFDDGRALGLFIQMLVLALIAGAGIFLLMYKLIEYPFLRLNQEIDAALREGRDHAQINIRFPLLQQVLVSVNSLLSRNLQGGGGMAAASAATQDHEWMNMIGLFGYPAMLLSKEMQVIAINAPFESLTGVQGALIQGQSLAYLPDQALQKNIENLANLALNQTAQLHQDRLEFGGHQFSLQCQAITVAGEARYYLLSISPFEQSEGGAA